MLQVNTIAAVREQVAAWHRVGDTVAFVPTMGNLHAGHLALVAAARKLADHVVVSIFVNPLQFGPNEDFDRYPRTLAEDAAKLEQVEADLLFAPPVEEIYPHGQVVATKVDVPGVSEGLCGAMRPGHFVGVATVVAKLFNIVQPDLAIFGEKDFQQLQVIRKMVNDLCMPIEIVGVSTMREADGLALSSRNQYLSTEERSKAGMLYQQLRAAADQLSERDDFSTLESEAMKALHDAGFEPEYFAIRNAETLLPAEKDTSELVILVAARLGNTRLIDNISLSLVK